MNPTAIVQQQLEAYNDRHLERFAATYSESVTIYRMPATEPAIAGKAKLREVYKDRFASPDLHAEIVNRIVMGNKVIDHERVKGIRDVPIEAVAVYEVVAGLIQTVWFFYPDNKPFPPSKGS